jgi:hypothetical protein
MQTREKILLIFLVILTIASLSLSFFNSVIRENFQVVNQEK